MTITLRPYLYGVCSLLLTVGLVLSGRSAAHAQAPAFPHLYGQRPDANNSLASLQFDTQIGLRIEPPEQSPRSWTWHRIHVDSTEPPYIIALTRDYTPVAADEGAYLAVCYVHAPWYCSPWTGPVKPAIPPSGIEGLRWSEGSGLSGLHNALAVNDEIQIRGGGLGARSQPFGTWWQRSPNTRINVFDIETLETFPDDIETFVYLSHPEQWANPDVQALPADQGSGANRRYLTTDDIGRYVRGCWYRPRDAQWVCTSWRGPIVATVNLPDEYRLEIVGVPSHVDVRGTAPVTWYSRPANDARRAPTQVATDANPYTPAAADEGHYLRACQAIGDDRACTRWLGSVLPPIPITHRGDYPRVGSPGPVYVDRPSQRPVTYHVGDHLTARTPDTLQPIPLAPNGHVSQLVWMVLVAGDGTPQNPRRDRVLHIGPDFILPRQYRNELFRVCLYGANGQTHGWGCHLRETIR